MPTVSGAQDSHSTPMRALLVCQPNAPLCSRVCFLPAGHAADVALTSEVARRGAVLGVHVPLVCAGPQWDQTDLFQRQWEEAVEATQAAKAAGQKVKVVLHDALSADTWDLALAAANLCDAGADILMVEARGSDVDQEELRERLDAMCENDVLGVPMTMRLGAHAPAIASARSSLGSFGPQPLGSRGTARRRALRTVVARAVGLWHRTDGGEPQGASRLCREGHASVPLRHMPSRP